MKLREYIKHLQELAEKHPEALEMDVITAKDAEGNGYEAVYYEPSMGHYDGEDFTASDSEDYDEDYENNAICVN